MIQSIQNHQNKIYWFKNFSFWILLSFIPALILYKVVFKHGIAVRDEKFWGIFFQCLTSGYIAWAILFSQYTLQKEKNVFIELIQSNNKDVWFTKKINDIYKGTYAFIIQIVTAILLILTPFLCIGNPLSTPFSLQFYITFSTLSIVMGGGASTVFLIALFMVRYASDCSLDFSFVQYPYSKFKHVVQLHLKFTLITAVGLLFASFMTYFYWKFQIFTVLWYILGIFSVIFFFYFPQKSFYKILQSKKIKELQEISKQLDLSYKKLINEHNKGDFESFKEMHDTAEIINKLHSLPFDLRYLVPSSVTVVT